MHGYYARQRRRRLTRRCCKTAGAVSQHNVHVWLNGYTNGLSVARDDGCRTCEGATPRTTVVGTRPRTCCSLSLAPRREAYATGMRRVGLMSRPSCCTMFEFQNMMLHLSGHAAARLKRERHHCKYNSKPVQALTFWL